MTEPLRELFQIAQMLKKKNLMISSWLLKNWKEWLVNLFLLMNILTMKNQSIHGWFQEGVIN